jgi:hypothetical protein
MKWLILWLIMVAVVALVVGSLNVPFYYRLITNGVKAQATIIELTPQIHNTVRYEYQVEGRSFKGQRSPSSPNSSTDQISVGQSLVIYYDPLNPSLSVPGDPKPMLTNELISVGMAALGIPTFIIFVLMQNQYKKRSKASTG